MIHCYVEYDTFATFVGSGGLVLVGGNIYLVYLM